MEKQNVSTAKWNSRRSPAYSTKGMVACTQPLAAAIGVRVLNEGGTAADAAIAMAAAMNVVEPCSTGLGGDAFALYYEASSRRVHCLMGNGAAPQGLSLKHLSSLGVGTQVGQQPLDLHSGLAVTVPGAAMLWSDLVEIFGARDLAANLQPAIELAEDGFVLGPVTSAQWRAGFLKGEEALRVFRGDGRGPLPGDLVRNPDLASVLRDMAEKGVAGGFYRGRVAEAVVAAAREHGGVLAACDLEAHRTQQVVPISSAYKGYRVHETPPPTHGVAALVALNVLEQLHAAPPVQRCNDSCLESCEERLQARGSAQQAHLAIEAMRVAFSDALQYVCDPATNPVPLDKMLSKEYAQHRAASITAANCTACTELQPLDQNAAPFATANTVYFSVIDSRGNGCSFINSNYTGFGTGIVPVGCGFTLQNRACNFSLDPSHPNCVAPGKKPYHTIIPALVTREDGGEGEGSLYAVLGVMGGFMQPQGHVQVLRNLLDFGMSPQDALDAPRWYIEHIGRTQSPEDVRQSTVYLEDCYGGRGDGGDERDVGEAVLQALRDMGHSVTLRKGAQRSVFGKGQIITRDAQTGVLTGGSDPRADGLALASLA